ncbi:MAG: glycosyltransferase [Polyangiales bacterium]
MSPRFSVIVPVFNRAAMISRAIDSALAQGFDDFEVIVVDDGSTDRTADRVRAYADPRVRLVALGQNRGVCAARNAAIVVATGAWCVMLDSDFELLPGALEALDARCREAAPEVVNVASACQWDDGSRTPVPFPDEEFTADYESWLRWTASLTVSEYFNCVRRSCLARVLYPEGRTYEAAFHLALARLGRFWFSPRPAVLVRTDADNRITASPPASFARRLLRDAPDCAADAENVLREHGEALRRLAPREYARLASRAVEAHLLAGDRLGAFASRLSRPVVGAASTDMAVSALGLVHPRLLAAARGLWRHRATLSPSTVVDALGVVASAGNGPR